jgi:type I restriction enzyme S subunit
MSNNNQNVAFVPLGTVANSVKGKKPPVLKDKSTAGMVPYIDIDAFENGVFKRYTDPSKTVPCDDGDVLMVWDGSRSGLVGRGRQGALGSTLAKINVPLVEKSYLFYFLESLYPMINSRAKGVGIPHVNPDLLWSSLFPVVSAKQQRRVVSKIEELVTRIESSIKDIKLAQSELKRYRASVLAAAYSGKLVPTEAELSRSKGKYETGAELLARILKERRENWSGRGAYKEPTAPEVGDLPKLPEGWVWSSLGEAFEVFVGATPSRARSDYWGGDVAWVSSGEVAFCSITKTRETITTLGLENSSTKVHPIGTVMLGMIGEGKTRGQVAILKIPAAHNQNTAAIRVSPTEIPPSYVYRFLEGRYEVTRGAGSGNNQPALNKTIVEQIPIPLAPLAEGKRIVEEMERRLSVVDEIEAVLSANLQRAERLRQSILQRAFSGKLVPQDASDESAAALLERINTEHASATARKKVTSKVHLHSKAK